MSSWILPIVLAHLSPSTEGMDLDLRPPDSQASVVISVASLLPPAASLLLLLPRHPPPPTMEQSQAHSHSTRSLRGDRILDSALVKRAMAAPLHCTDRKTGREQERASLWSLSNGKGKMRSPVSSPPLIVGVRAGVWLP